MGDKFEKKYKILKMSEKIIFHNNNNSEKL